MTRTRTTRYVTLLSVVLALALTAALVACGSDEPSGVTGPDRTASPPTETPGSGDAPTATDAPAPGSPATDREILVTVYNALDGPNWEDSENWLSDAPLGEWSGVTTDDNGRVIWLRIGGSGSGQELSGEIPSEVGDLGALEILDLSGGFHGVDLRGEIPPELSNLSNLLYLQIHGNGFTGEIPPELGNLSNLTNLQIEGNGLTGGIPSELGNMASLSDLLLRGEGLSGGIPPELAGC